MKNNFIKLIQNEKYLNDLDVHKLEGISEQILCDLYDKYDIDDSWFNSVDKDIYDMNEYIGNKMAGDIPEWHYQPKEKYIIFINKAKLLFA